MKKIITLLALFSIAGFTQQQGTFTDLRDGKKYKTVKIGTQTWMAQNLDYHGSDGYLGLCFGDEPQRKIKYPERCQKYGRLYDWSEAMKACPKGWHLPSTNEWVALVNFAGGGSDKVLGKKLKAKGEWKEAECKWTEEKVDNRGRVTVIEHDKCSTDEFGFSALPGGIYEKNRFDHFNFMSSWWASSSSENGTQAFFTAVYNNREDMGGGYTPKINMVYVRCLQDR